MRSPGREEGGGEGGGGEGVRGEGGGKVEVVTEDGGWGVCTATIGHQRRRRYELVCWGK